MIWKRRIEEEKRKTRIFSWQRKKRAKNKNRENGLGGIWGLRHEGRFLRNFHPRNHRKRLWGENNDNSENGQNVRETSNCLVKVKHLSETSSQARLSEESRQRDKIPTRLLLDGIFFRYERFFYFFSFSFIHVQKFSLFFSILHGNYRFSSSLSLARFFLFFLLIFFVLCCSVCNFFPFGEGWKMTREALSGRNWRCGCAVWIYFNDTVLMSLLLFFWFGGRGVGLGFDDDSRKSRISPCEGISVARNVITTRWLCLPAMRMHFPRAEAKEGKENPLNDSRN